MITTMIAKRTTMMALMRRTMMIPIIIIGRIIRPVIVAGVETVVVQASWFSIISRITAVGVSSFVYSIAKVNPSAFPYCIPFHSYPTKNIIASFPLLFPLLLLTILHIWLGILVMLSLVCVLLSCTLPSEQLPVSSLSKLYLKICLLIG